jgi:hypothetical protein
MLLIALRVPTTANAAAAAAQAMGLVLADVTRRLAGPLPRIMMVDSDPDRVEAARARLDALGFITAACAPEAVPSDEDRLVARRMTFEGSGFVAYDGQGNRHPCPKDAISLFQRGVRISTAEAITKETTKKFDVGRAIMSGGLLLTKKSTTTSTKVTETREAFLIVHRNDGEPDIIMYERQMDYRALGAAMQPSSFSNLDLLAKQLAALVPGAPTDARIGRPGFVNSLPLCAANPVDLAIFLIALAHRRGVL